MWAGTVIFSNDWAGRVIWSTGDNKITDTQIVSNTVGRLVISNTVGWRLASLTTRRQLVQK